MFIKLWSGWFSSRPGGRPSRELYHQMNKPPPTIPAEVIADIPLQTEFRAHTHTFRSSGYWYYLWALHVCSLLRFWGINNPQLQISFPAQITQTEPSLQCRGSLTITSSKDRETTVPSSSLYSRCPEVFYTSHHSTLWNTTKILQWDQQLRGRSYCRMMNVSKQLSVKSALNRWYLVGILQSVWRETEAPGGSVT